MSADAVVYLAQPYNDDDLEAQRKAVMQGRAEFAIVSRLFATIDALRIEKGYKACTKCGRLHQREEAYCGPCYAQWLISQGYHQCVKCRQLRPPHGTRDSYNREAGFYMTQNGRDLTCAPCRRDAANDRYLRHGRR